MLGRYVLPVVRKTGLKWLLDPISELIAGRYVVANLESPLSRCRFPHESDGSPVLQAPVEIATQLREAGISAVSLANNHVFDRGLEGLDETIQTLDASGIAHTGAGMDLASATRPVIIHTDGYKIGIISFSYTPPAREDHPGVAYLYDDTVDYAISVARKEADFLVAMVHAGIELFQYPLPQDQRVYRKMIDLGVDLVVGSHPHCVQAMEVYKERFIFYSLGDCIFDHHHEAVWKSFWKDSAHPRKFSITATPGLPRHSLMVMIDFSDDRMNVSYEPLVMRDLPGPQPLVSDERKRWFAQFEEVCSRLLSDQTIQEKRVEIEKTLIKSLRARGLA